MAIVLIFCIEGKKNYVQNGKTAKHLAVKQLEIILTSFKESKLSMLTDKFKEKLANSLKKLFHKKALKEFNSTKLEINDKNSIEYIFSIIGRSISAKNFEEATSIGKIALNKSFSLEEKDTLSKMMAACAFQAEVINNLKTSAEAYYLAYITINDKGQLRSKYFQIQLFYLLRGKFFDEASKLYKERPSDLVSLEKNPVFTPPFVEVASEFESKGDFESSIICYELALEFKIIEPKVVTEKIIGQHQHHLHQLISNGLYDEAIFFNDRKKQKYRVLNLQALKIIDVKKFCEENSYKHHEIKPSRIILEPVIRFFAETVTLDSLCGALNAPPQYAATIHNCIAFPRSNSLISNDYLISDLAANVYSENIIIGDLNIEHNSPLIVSHNSKRAITNAPAVTHQKIPSGLMMFGVQSKNYGHWVCEFLPRMLAFDTLAFSSEIPIYIDDNMPDSHIESLELLNSLHRPILKIPKTSVHFSKIGLAPVPAYFPLETKSGVAVYDTVWPRDIFNELKEKIISSVRRKYPVSLQKRNRLFISRKNFNLRQIKNELEIINLLRPYGFEVIFPEELTFTEQVIIFSNAEFIIGSCSSALTNCLFCPPDCKIIGMIHESASFNFRGYTSFIEAGGASITFLRGKTTEPSKINEFHDNYEISIEKLRSAVEQNLSTSDYSSEVISLRNFNESEDARLIFDRKYFSRRHPNLGSGFGLWMYREKYEAGLNPSPLFDDLFYKSQLKQEITSRTALDHYLLFGADLGLDPSPLFSTNHYLATYPDVKSANINPLVHFLEHGRKAGLLPVPMDHFNLRRNCVAIFEQDPDNEYARAWIVSFYLRDGNLQEAVNSIHRLDQEEARRYVINVAFFTVFFELEQTGRRVEAIAAYEKLLEFSPDSSFFRYQLAMILRSWGDIEGTERQLNLGSKINENPLPQYYIDSLDALQKERIEGQKLAKNASDFFAKNRTQDALEIIDKINLVNPNLLEPHEQDSFSSKKILAKDNQPSFDEKKLLIIDTIFPSRFSSFRFGEFLEILDKIPESRVMSSIWDTPQLHKSTSFFEVLENFSVENKTLRSRVGALHQKRDFDADLVYTVFLNNAALLWQDHPKMQSTRCIFTLYPGGGFSLNDSISDIKLRKLCNDKRLQKIITTQKTTKDYLIENNFCESDRILHIFGGIVPNAYKPLILRPQSENSTLNVCFVAQRYSEMGVEKGGDVFAKIANRFKDSSELKFHFVGDWSASIFDLDFGENAIFHGVQKSNFFEDFYSQMDIIISPNVSSYEISGCKGSFDGFPTTACVEAGLAGVAMFLSDSLNQNISESGSLIFKPSIDFELITRDIDQICTLLQYYVIDRDALHCLAKNGQTVLHHIFSFDTQMKPRINLLKTELAACPSS